MEGEGLRQRLVLGEILLLLSHDPKEVRKWMRGGQDLNLLACTSLGDYCFILCSGRKLLLTD